MTKTTNAKKVNLDANPPIIKIEKLNKWFGKFHVLKDIDLEVNKTEKIVICGPSGSGKSTLIRCINRLEVHQEGSIIVDGTELTDDVKLDARLIIYDASSSSDLFYNFKDQDVVKGSLKYSF